MSRTGQAQVAQNPRAIRSLARSAFERADIVLASVAINLFSLALPLVILQTYDRVIPNEGHQTFVFLLIGLAVVIVLDGGVRMIRSYVTAWNAARFEHAVGCRVVDRMLSAPLLDFEREPPGTQLARFGAIETLRDLYAGQGMQALIDIPFVILFLALIGMIGGWLVAVPLAVIVVVGLFAIAVGRDLRRFLEARQVVDDRRYSFVIEALSNMQLVKGLALESLVLRRYERLLRSSCEAIYDVIGKSGAAQTLGSLFSNLTMVSVAGFGAVLVLDEHMTLGMLAASMLLAGRSVQPMLRAISVWTQFQGVKVAESRVQEVMALPREAAGTRRDDAAVSGGFEFHDVGFVYPRTGVSLFRNLDFAVEFGETVAIVGQNGSGKSTLLWLAMGLLAPTAGRVLHGGVDTSSLDPAALRRQIAYLPQRGALFRGTIRDNLTMFAGEDRLDSAMEYAHALGLDEALAKLPRGLDTELSSSTHDVLAAGVRQRIAIVRALAVRPRLVLFDEANSAFDLRTDERLRELFHSLHGEVTMVLVSHRPSLIGLSDKVFEIDDGALRPARREPVSESPASVVEEKFGAVQ